MSRCCALTCSISDNSSKRRALILSSRIASCCMSSSFCFCLSRNRFAARRLPSNFLFFSLFKNSSSVIVAVTTFGVELDFVNDLSSNIIPLPTLLPSASLDGLFVEELSPTEEVIEEFESTVTLSNMLPYDIEEAKDSGGMTGELMLKVSPTISTFEGDVGADLLFRFPEDFEGIESLDGLRIPLEAINVETDPVECRLERFRFVAVDCLEHEAVRDTRDNEDVGVIGSGPIRVLALLALILF